MVGFKEIVLNCLICSKADQILGLVLKFLQPKTRLELEFLFSDGHFDAKDFIPRGPQ